MSFISAGNTTTTTLVVNGDTTGNLVFNTGGANTTALTLTNAQNATFAGTITAAGNTVATTNQVIGVGQTWQAVSRAIGTTYTNSTGKPIMVAITFTCSQNNTVQGLTINGVIVYTIGSSVATYGSGFSLIVPDGATYVTATNGGTLTLVTWAELR